VSEIEGEAREPNGSSVGPWTGADSAAHLADYEGTNISVTISTGGTQVGGGGSSSGGIARWTVRIESEAGYSGPSTLDIDLRAQVVVNGDFMINSLTIDTGDSASHVNGDQLTITLGGVSNDGQILVNGAKTDRSNRSKQQSNRSRRSKGDREKTSNRSRRSKQKQKQTV